MGGQSSVIMCLLIILAIFTAGCTDTINGNKSYQSATNSSKEQISINVNKSSEHVFEKIDYNISKLGYMWPQKNYETATADPELFMESIVNNTIKLNLIGNIVEIKFDDISGLDTEKSIFKGHIVGVSDSSASFTVSKKDGTILGTIRDGNKVYNILNTVAKYNGKNVEIIYSVEYQPGNLKLTVIPDKSELKEGESTALKVVLTNIGNNTLNVWKMEHQTSYDISFISVKNDLSAKYICGVLSRAPLTDNDLVELKPGESVNSTILSSCWTLNPGEYKISAVYHTHTGGYISDPFWLGEVKSNDTLIQIIEV